MKTLKFFVVSLTVIILTACTPTIKKISQETIDDFNYQRGVNDGIEIGYNMAIEVARKEYEDRMFTQLSKFKEHVLYLQLVKGGILEPARVVTELVDGQVSGDGKSYVSPYLKWSVVKDPSFNLDRSLRWKQRDDENFCYLFIVAFDDYKKALKELSIIQRPKSGYIVLFDIVRRISQNNKDKFDYALIAKVPRGYCTEARDFYTMRGYDVIMDISAPRIQNTKN